MGAFAENPLGDLVGSKRWSWAGLLGCAGRGERGKSWAAAQGRERGFLSFSKFDLFLFPNSFWYLKSV
jgi:hypothetical protein